MSDSDSTIPTGKVCSKCGLVLPATSEFFGRRRDGRDGLRANCKGCRAQENTAWREAHPGYQREWLANKPGYTRDYLRRWSLLHPGKMTEYKRAWALRDPERRRAQDRRMYFKHFARIAARKVVYRRARAAEIREYQQNYARAHPEWVKAKSSRRRALKRASGGEHNSADIREQYNRQKGHCFYCGIKVGRNYHTDHVTPLAKGGSNGPENLVIACPRCNLSKGGKHPMDYCGRLL